MRLVLEIDDEIYREAEEVSLANGCTVEELGRRIMLRTIRPTQFEREEAVREALRKLELQGV